MEISESRKAFERWVARTGPLSLYEIREARFYRMYVYSHLNSQWLAWQASQKYAERVRRKK